MMAGFRKNKILEFKLLELENLVIIENNQTNSLMTRGILVRY
jgi:hypothetical protein